LWIFFFKKKGGVNLFIEKRYFKFICDAIVLGILKNESEKRKISKSMFIRNAICEYSLKNNELKGYEREYVDAIQKENKINLVKFLRSKNMQKITLLNNIHKTIFRLRMNQHWIEKKDLINNLNYTQEICKINGWRKERKEVRSLIKEFKARLILERKKGIVVTQREKIIPEVVKHE
jgi:hypothetical protein